MVQRAVLDFLSQKYGARLANYISYGFVLGRTVKSALAEACRLRGLAGWVYKTDIQSFFDRISRERLRQDITRNIRDTSLHPLLFAAINCEIDTDRRAVRNEITKQDIKNGIGLRQGMPLSPFLSNLVLRDFDLAIQQRGYLAIRYADDLIFFANSKTDCQQIHTFCENELEKHGHTIPPLSSDQDSKTKIYGPAEVADFLGLGISPRGNGYVARVTHQQLDKIRTLLLMLSHPRELTSRGIRLATFGMALQSRIDGYLHAYEDCANYGEVERQIHEIGEKIKRVLYTEHLKIDFKTLSEEARSFIGI
jgi:hypothetical protein